MKRKVSGKVIATALTVSLLTTSLTGCTFGFASDPDDPNEVAEEVPIDTSVDTFAYDSSLSGTSITLLNSKAEIQVALEKMSAAYEEKSGVHVEVMPVTDGDSPYTKVVSLYNSGNPPTLAILDTTDVIALAEEKAADLSDEPWTAQAQGYLTEVNGKVCCFPLCIEGRGIIYNKAVIEEALGREFDPASIRTQDGFVALLEELKAYNAFEWNADRDTIVSWSKTEGYPADATYDRESGYKEGIVHETYATESLAKFAFSILWQAAEFSLEHGVVIVYDF